MPTPPEVRRQKRLDALAKARYGVPITFVVAGVQKGATSTLYRMLDRHDRIAGGPEKELNFFTQESADWLNPDYSSYVRPADSRSVDQAGDATPAYLTWPHAFERMHRYRPDLRIVSTVRDPIERAVSQWCMERARREGVPEFTDAIREWASPQLPEEVPPGCSSADFRIRTMFTRGLYGQAMQRCLASFDRQQVLFLDFTEVVSDHRTTLDRVTDFLGLARFERHPRLKHANPTRADEGGGSVTVGDIERLVQVYADDLPRFGALSGLDIRHWSTCRVLAGDQTVADLADGVARKAGLRLDGRASATGTFARR